jgi:Outer membrane protein beta-barrel domain
MENLDDMFQQSLAHDEPAARFEFREEYWQQAVLLLEADERRRKRRIIFWWSSAAVAALALVATFWYTSSHTPAATTQPMAQTGPLPAVQPALVPPVTSYENNNTSSTNHHTTKSVDNSIYNKKSNPTNHVKQTTPLSNIQASGLNTTIAAPQHEQSRRTIETIPDYRATNEQRASLNNKTIDANNPITELLNENTTTPIAENNTLTIETTTPATTLQENNSTTVPMQHRPLQDQTTIALLPSMPLTNELTPITQTGTPMPPETIKRVSQRPSRIQWGLVAGIASPVNVSAEEHWSLSAGGTFHYQFAQRWGLQAELNWRQRSFNYYTASLNGLSADAGDLQNSHFDPVLLADNTTTTTNYSFGAISSVYLRNLSRFHLLELPLSVTYQHRRLGFEAGVTGSMVAVVTGKYNVAIATQTGSNDYNNTNRSVTKSSLLPNGSTLNRFNYGFLAGINYALGRHWAIGTRLHWLPNRGVLNSDELSPEYFQTITGSISQPQVRTLRGELRLHYYF